MIKWSGTDERRYNGPGGELNAPRVGACAARPGPDVEAKRVRLAAPDALQAASP